MGNGMIGKLISKVRTLKKDQLLIIVLSGVLLMVIALPVDNSKDSAEGNGAIYQTVEDKQQTNTQRGAGTLTSGSTTQGNEMADDIVTGEDYYTYGDYVAYMEDKVARVLSGMDQVGNAEVVITLKSSSEKIVEKDTPITRSNTDEQDSQGGSRVISSVDTGESTIYVTESGKSTPYVVKTTSPQVEGVLVVCEGAGEGSVSKNITDAIEVLFGIEPHKIKVVKMKTR